MAPSIADASAAAAAAELKKVAEFLEKITHFKTGELAPFLHTTMADTARRLADEVRASYMSYNKPRSVIGRLSIIRGKAKGKHPARPPRATTTPPLRRLAEAVRTRPGVAYRFEHFIEIDPNKRHPDPRINEPAGRPLTAIAYWVENPKPVAMPISARMRVYLSTLSDLTGGYNRGGMRRRTGATKRNKKGWGNDLVGMLIIRPTSMPAWHDAAVKSQELVPRHAVRPFMEKLSSILHRYMIKSR